MWHDVLIVICFVCVYFKARAAPHLLILVTLLTLSQTALSARGPIDAYYRSLIHCWKITLLLLSELANNDFISHKFSGI